MFPACVSAPFTVLPTSRCPRERREVLSPPLADNTKNQPGLAPPPPAGDWQVTGQVQMGALSLPTRAARPGCYCPSWLNAWAPLTPPEGPGNLHVWPSNSGCSDDLRGTLPLAAPTPVQTLGPCAGPVFCGCNGLALFSGSAADKPRDLR